MYDFKLDILEIMEISKTSVLYSSSVRLYSVQFQNMCTTSELTFLLQLKCHACATDCKAMPCHKMQLYV